MPKLEKEVVISKLAKRNFCNDFFFTVFSSFSEGTLFISAYRWSLVWIVRRDFLDNKRQSERIQGMAPPTWKRDLSQLFNLLKFVFVYKLYSFLNHRNCFFDRFFLKFRFCISTECQRKFFFPSHKTQLRERKRDLFLKYYEYQNIRIVVLNSNCWIVRLFGKLI